MRIPGRTMICAAAVVMLLMAGMPLSALGAQPVLVAHLAHKPGRHAPLPRLLVEPGGALLALWADGRKLQIAYSKDGKTWQDGGGGSATLTLTSKLFGRFDAALGADGTVHVIWGTRHEIDYAILPGDDRSWKSIKPTILESGRNMDNPTLCLTPSGKVWAAYHFGGTQGRVGIRAKELGGKERKAYTIAWGFEGSIQKLAMWRGQPLLVYTSETAFGSSELYWTRYDAKADRWTPGQIGIGRCVRSPGNFDVASDAQGVTHVIWRTFPSSHVILYSRSFANQAGAATWSAVQTLATGKVGSAALTEANSALRCAYRQGDALQRRDWHNGQWNQPRSVTLPTVMGKLALPRHIKSPTSLPMLWIASSDQGPALYFQNTNW